ncbi:hypothetical protein KIW84_013526 [Lathyrus oleraceus]|uniref:Uncharacterized protein n=1 Tax=Pisum sativum TaxID=3888 RepID=A0A9D5BKN3_PEA|nr:hypothetical protein KIW84_013526 [Pisum sativum]
MIGLHSGLPVRDRIVHSSYVIPLPKPDLSLSGRLVRLSFCERRWLYRKCCGFGGRLGRSLFGFGRLLVWDDLSGLGIYYGIRSFGLCEANKQGIELRESRVRAFVFLLGTRSKRMPWDRSDCYKPLADGLKLILKEPISPSSANFSLFGMAPVATFMLSLVARAVVPFDCGMVLSDSNIGILYLFAISSLGVYGIITTVACRAFGKLTPSISNRTCPVDTRAIQAVGFPFPLPILTSVGFPTCKKGNSHGYRGETRLVSSFSNGTYCVYSCFTRRLARSVSRESRLTHWSRASIAKRLSIPAKQVGISVSLKLLYGLYRFGTSKLLYGSLELNQAIDHIQPSSADERLGWKLPRGWGLLTLFQDGRINVFSSGEILALLHPGLDFIRELAAPVEAYVEERSQVGQKRESEASTPTTLTLR